MNALSADDKADLKLLKLANEKNKFGMEIMLVLEDDLQYAFERGIDGDWFTLVDLCPLLGGGGAICRVFKLTAAGIYRRACLESHFETKQ